MEEMQEERESIKDMTEEERKAYFEEIKEERGSILEELVEEGIISEEEAEKIQEILKK